MQRRSFSNVGAFANLSRGGGERFLAHAPRPRGSDHTHAQNALGGAQEVDAARDRPPPIAGFLEELEALQPSVLPERRDVALEPTPSHFEAEQRESILEAVERNEVS